MGGVSHFAAVSIHALLIMQMRMALWYAVNFDLSHLSALVGLEFSGL